MLRNLKHGVLNLIKWFPIIWKDRDWDQQFLYEMLKFKLEQMQNFQRKYGHGLHRDKYANQMKVCTSLLSRLIEDEYQDGQRSPVPETLQNCKGGIRCLYLQFSRLHFWSKA